MGVPPMTVGRESGVDMKFAVNTCAVLGVLAFSACADTITLTNGKVLDGRATDNGDTVTVELSQGTVRIPKAQVKSIEKKETAQDEVAQQTAGILAKIKDGTLDAAGQIEAWLKIARFADQHQLTHARDDAFKRVIALDPDNAEAREGLGFVQYNGKWMTDAERYQAMGMVRFEGKWVSREALADVQKAREAEQTRKVEADQAAAQRQQAELDLKDAETRRLDAQRQLIEAQLAQNQAQQALTQQPFISSDAGVVLIPVPANAAQTGVPRTPAAPATIPAAPPPPAKPKPPTQQLPNPANTPSLPNPANTPSLPNAANTPSLPNPANTPNLPAGSREE